MIVLGMGGGLDRVYENRIEFPTDMAHDAAAVLLSDGKVIAAIEEERLTRIKHTNKAPLSAIRFCLSTAGKSLEQINKIAVYGSEKYLDLTLKRLRAVYPERSLTADGIRPHILQLFKEEFRCEMAADKIVFVPHHYTHAVSAFAMSGFDKSLVLTIDGQGDGISGTVWDAEGSRIEPMQTFYEGDSLGFFYMEVIKFLGYSMFDEYKVMGLAPYGDPRRYRRIFKLFYSLLPDGNYTINFHQISVLFQIVSPRLKNEPFSQVHKDIAASLQEALEEIVFHILGYFRQKTGHTNLCMAGGVAHNCTLNGKLLYAGMFDNMFVQPAAHDAGSALGAALSVYMQESPEPRSSKLDHLYWGTDIGGTEAVRAVLDEWQDLVEYEKSDRIEDDAAQLLAEGKVIGWVQGRSEFGPRALGNRSIIADPRPAENREIINGMIKMREGYRPFAPSVLEEEARELFEIPEGQQEFPYMIFVLKVKKERRELLGAVTHVDGTARVQTVSSETNPKYWRLIRSFADRTGVPVVLNTSFNNNVEPIVDSVADAIVCFLTTKLHYLIVGDFIVRRKIFDPALLLNMVPSLPVYGKLSEVSQFTSDNQMATSYKIGCGYNEKYDTAVCSGMYRLLMSADTSLTVGERLSLYGEPPDERIILELLELWAKRLIVLKPDRAGAAEYRVTNTSPFMEERV